MPIELLGYPFLMMKTPLLTLVVVWPFLWVLTSAQQHQPQAKPDHMHHRFDDPERYAKSFDDPARDGWQMPSRVIEALALSPNASVADIGAGTGYFTIRLAKALPRGTIYAVDVESAMLAHIRKRAQDEGLKNVITVHASEARPNLPNSVDLVLVVDTYHHLPNRRGYFRDIHNLLTKGGRVAVIDFRKDSPEGPPPEFRFEADQIIGEMQQAGYRLVAKHEFLPRQHFLVFQVEAGRP